MRVSILLLSAIVLLSIIVNVTGTTIIDATEKNYQTQFSAFIKKYHKVYPADSFFNRYNVFKQNLNRIAEHQNSDNKAFTMDINEFADMSWTEFYSKMVSGGYQPRRMDYARSLLAPSLDHIVAAPAIDWRNATTINGKKLPKGAVTPVKNQGQCGSVSIIEEILYRPNN